MYINFTPTIGRKVILFDSDRLLAEEKIISIIKEIMLSCWDTIENISKHVENETIIEIQETTGNYNIYKKWTAWVILWLRTR